MTLIKWPWSFMLAALVLALAGSMACDKKASVDYTEEEGDAKKDKKKKDKKDKKKKGKKKKDKGDDDDSDKTKSASSGGPLADRKKKLAWADDDFDNTTPANDTFETGSESCNAVLNACMACRDRVKADEGDMKLWSATVSACFNLKTAVLALDEGKRTAACDSLKTKMKGADDCVTASHEAEANLK